MALASSSRLVSTSSRLGAAVSTAASTSTPFNPAGPTFLTFPEGRGVLPHTDHHVATLTLHANHPYPLDLYTNFAYHTARSLQIPTSKPASLPTDKSLFTVLKSPFVHKKAQENFERRTHKRVIKVFDANKEVLDLWFRYLRKNSIGGVGMKAQLWERVEYGYGRREEEQLGQQAGEAEARAKQSETAANKIEREADVLRKGFSEEEVSAHDANGESSFPLDGQSSEEAASAEEAKQ